MPHLAPPLSLPTVKRPFARTARVKCPNTPESDRLLRVMHVVTFSDGSTAEMMATDPLNALDLANGHHSS